MLKVFKIIMIAATLPPNVKLDFKYDSMYSVLGVCGNKIIINSQLAMVWWHNPIG